MIINLIPNQFVRSDKTGSVRKAIILPLAMLILSSCGATLKSIVDSNLTKPYVNPLIVIPYDRSQGTRFWTKSLKLHLERVFTANNQNVEVIALEGSRSPLALNSGPERELNQMINDKIAEDNKDLIIYFKPLRAEFYNNSLQSVSYEIVGTDVESKREVWKANFSASGSFGPSVFAESSAKKIFERLRNDRVIN